MICVNSCVFLRASHGTNAGQLHLAVVRSRAQGEPPRARRSLRFLGRNAATALVTIVCGSPFTYHFLYRSVLNDAFGFAFLYVTFARFPCDLSACRMQMGLPVCRAHLILRPPCRARIRCPTRRSPRASTTRATRPRASTPSSPLRGWTAARPWSAGGLRSRGVPTRPGSGSTSRTPTTTRTIRSSSDCHAKPRAAKKGPPGKERLQPAAQRLWRRACVTPSTREAPGLRCRLLRVVSLSRD